MPRGRGDPSPVCPVSGAAAAGPGHPRRHGSPCPPSSLAPAPTAHTHTHTHRGRPGVGTTQHWILATQSISLRGGWLPANSGDPLRGSGVLEMRETRASDMGHIGRPSRLDHPPNPPPLNVRCGERVGGGPCTRRASGTPPGGRGWRGPRAAWRAAAWGSPQSPAAGAAERRSSGPVPRRRATDGRGRGDGALGWLRDFTEWVCCG